MRLLFIGVLALASQISFASVEGATSLNSEWFSLSSFADPYREFFNSVSKDHLITQLKNMTGVNSVTVDGATFSIPERYSPESKRKFRAYWTFFFKSLGMEVEEFSYPTRHSVGEREGHNLEAVLPGKSKDSFVIIVHYDSIGPWRQETENPGVDDDMTGMAVMLETARLLAPYKGRLQYTVRFVATDYEEHGALEGARMYANHIRGLSEREGFKIVAAVDNEQSGWNCAKEGGCRDGSQGDVFDLFSCSPNGRYDSRKLGDTFEEITKNYSNMRAKRACMGPNSDHYAMWEIGVQTVVYSEHEPFYNPHFDQSGGDTFDKIDQDYFFNIAQIGATFAARIAGISP